MTRGDEQGGYGGAFFDPVTGKPVDTSQSYEAGGYQQSTPQQPGDPRISPQGQQGYQSPSGYPLPPPPASGGSVPTRSGNPGKIISITFAVIVVVLIALFGFMFLGRASDDEPRDRAAAPPPSSSTHPSPSSEPSEPAEQPGPPAKPVVPGWQAVSSPAKYGVAYDVPPEWKPQRPDMQVGFERPDPKAPFGYSPYLAGRAAAEFPGDCTAKGSFRGQTAILDVQDMALDEAASLGAAAWLKGATMDEQGKFLPIKPPKPTTVTLPDGTKAPSATTSAKPQKQGKCPAPSVRVTTVAISAKGHTRLLVITTDQQVAKTVDQGTIGKIASTLRTNG